MRTFPAEASALCSSASGVPALLNLPEMHAICSPGRSAIMTWRAGARMFAMLANGGQLAGIRLLTEDRLRAATGARPGAYDVDIVTGLVHWLGAGGYELGGTGPLTDPVGGEGDHILAAVGGSIGWADLDTRLAVVIAHNRIFGRLPRDENPLVSIGDALRELVHHD